MGCLQRFMSMNALLLFSGFSALYLAILEGHFLRFPTGAPQTIVLYRSSYGSRSTCGRRSGRRCRPVEAFTVGTLPTVNASTTRRARRPPRPTKCEARPPPAKDVGVLTMTLSAIANFRLRPCRQQDRSQSAHTEYQKCPHTHPQVVRQTTAPSPAGANLPTPPQKAENVTHHSRKCFPHNEPPTFFRNIAVFYISNLDDIFSKNL